MPPELYEILRVVAMGSTFLMVLAIWIAGVLVWTRRTAAKRDQMQQRLGIAPTVSSEKTLRLWTHGREVTTRVAELNHARSLLLRLEQTAFRAGWSASGWQIIVLLVGSAALLFCAFVVLTDNVFAAAGVVVSAFIILRIIVLGRIASREKLFETQFMDAMELAARSLRAGHPLLGAFQLISEEMPPPVRDVFGGICQQHGMGGELEDILRDAGRRAESEDMRLFATSVALQMRSGGNLADLMDRVARVIRERMRITRRIRVLTAQTQMSKRILLGLPVLIFVLFNVINPKYMSAFYNTTTGHVLLGVCLVMLGLGAWVMNKMVVIKV